jgi:hypothetical protein
VAGSKRFKKEKGIISGVQKARNDAFYYVIIFHKMSFV